MPQLDFLKDLVIVFGAMYLSDKRKGGYKAEEI